MTFGSSDTEVLIPPDARVLVVNPFGVGDVLFTTPLLRAVKARIPGGRLGFIANPRAAAVLEHHPCVDEVILFERDAFRRLSVPAFLREVGAFLGRIRASRYEVLLDLSLNATTGLLLSWAGVGTRVGFDYKGRGRFLTRRIPLTGFEGMHVVRYYNRLAEEVGIPVVSRRLEFVLSCGDRAEAAGLVRGRFGETPTVAVFPGGGASWGREAEWKRWPVDRFAVLVDKIVENHGAAVILMGQSGEEDLCRRAAARARPGRVLDLCGRTGLVQSAAVLACCRAAVVNDGGPLHVAAAVGTPAVAIFGPVDETVYGPYPPQGHRVVAAPVACRPCYRRFRRARCAHRRCLSDIGVEDVLRALSGLLDEDDRKDASASREER